MTKLMLGSAFVASAFLATAAIADEAKKEEKKEAAAAAPADKPKAAAKLKCKRGEKIVVAVKKADAKWLAKAGFKWTKGWAKVADADRPKDWDGLAAWACKAGDEMCGKRNDKAKARCDKAKDDAKKTACNEKATKGLETCKAKCTGAVAKAKDKASAWLDFGAEDHACKAPEPKPEAKKEEPKKEEPKK